MIQLYAEAESHQIDGLFVVPERWPTALNPQGLQGFKNKEEKVSSGRKVRLLHTQEERRWREAPFLLSNLFTLPLISKESQSYLHLDSA